MIEKWVNTIQCGDCLKLMKQLPDGCVDIILTDPPYNVGKDYGEQSNDQRPEVEYWEWYECRALEISRLLADRGFLYISSASSQVFKVKEIFERTNLKYIQSNLRWIQFLVWYGPNMVGGTTSYRMPWTQLHELISVFIKGKRQPMLNPDIYMNSHDVFVISRPQRNYREGRVHPTQKPLKLYLKILARTPGDLILDPFIGSGTTAVAAKQLGRRFIGFEINPDYVKIANERLKQEELSL